VAVLVRIFLREGDKLSGEPLYSAILSMLKSKGIRGFNSFLLKQEVQIVKKLPPFLSAFNFLLAKLSKKELKTPDNLTLRFKMISRRCERCFGLARRRRKKRRR